jgi:hypothetical protein
LRPERERAQPGTTERGGRVPAWPQCATADKPATRRRFDPDAAGFGHLDAEPQLLIVKGVLGGLSEHPDTIPTCLWLLDRAAELAAHPPRAYERPDASRLYRGH